MNLAEASNLAKKTLSNQWVKQNMSRERSTGKRYCRIKAETISLVRETGMNKESTLLYN